MILLILGMACLGHLAADFLQQFEELPMKPFKCNMCLSFWITIFPAMYIYGLEGILIATITSIVSETIYKFIV
jgi:hypothetical protein